MVGIYEVFLIDVGYFLEWMSKAITALELRLLGGV